MKHTKSIWLAAGLIAGALAMTGCAARTTPVVTPTPDTAGKTTAQPVTAAPDADAATSQPDAVAGGEETPGLSPLRVDGKELSARALEEDGKTLLPLIETAEALGWAAQEETTEEDAQTRRSVALSREDSRISVAWVVSDNTARQITWQKDGLLIPVDTMITTVDGVVYVPAAFFEEAMGVKITRAEGGVSVSLPEEKATPETQAQEENTSDVLP